MNRSFVDSAEPKPAYWRIVQSFPRYIVGYTPLVYGGLPGSPSLAAASKDPRVPAEYRGAISIPESVRFASSDMGQGYEAGTAATQAGGGPGVTPRRRG